LAALDHQEPDRVPFDLGATAVTGMHRRAYVALRAHLGLPATSPRVIDIVQQTVHIDADVADLLGVDARGVAGWYSPADTQETSEDLRFIDNFGIGWRMPKVGGLYFDLYHHPLQGDVDVQLLASYPWPRPPQHGELISMLDEARAVADEEGRAVIAESACGGIMETAAFLRGYEDFYSDVALNPRLAGLLLDRVLEFKLAYWDAALDLLGDAVDIIKESDDFGTQDSLLISPEAYRKLLKPRQKELFSAIRRKTGARIFLHSCGSIRSLIPDFIDVGVQILNPVQVSAAGMDTRQLKADFGREIVFWGGGIDTQRVLNLGSISEVRDEVRRRLDDLMPGGGFVFAAVHNVQADVPPENVMAMWDAVREFGVY
jgi:uroporphyrinogen decarboxylase